MIRITEKNNCCGCYACASICPKKCIEMKTDKEGFWYPTVDSILCLDCGLCEQVCPIINKWLPAPHRETVAIAAINKDNDVRLKSSSGGIFTAIAEWVISQNGIVIGAAFNDTFEEVYHLSVEKNSDIEKIRGSKYLQSRIGNSYNEAKKLLDSGRLVLFTGTPCQIAGLYAFLKKDYPNLYTQDLICHGVPSPLVWRKYLIEREKRVSSKTRRIFFRDKRYGWKTYAVSFEFANNRNYLKKIQDDSFMRLFLANSCLRPSCHNCSFKSIKRQADVTLADFWGVQTVLPEMDDDKGTSAILIHTEKGQQMISAILDKIKTHGIDIAALEKYNSALNHSVQSSQYRQYLFDSLETFSIDKLANVVTPISQKTRIKRMFSNMRIYKTLKMIKRHFNSIINP